MRLVREVFDFGRAEVRLRAFVVLLVAALLSPNIETPGGLPVVRAEQLLLAMYLPSLGWYLWQHREGRAFHVVDVALAVLAAAMMLTLSIAPVLVPDVGRSVRDIFELARVAEYWLMFRLGVTVVADGRTWRATAAVLGAGTVAVTAFALVQYLNPGGFNDAVTRLWTTEHNLIGLVRRGRVLGTTGNANYYGILSGFLLMAALAMVLLRAHVGHGRWVEWMAPLVAGAATLSLVMSQSRTAALAVLGTMFLGLLFVLWQRGWQAAYGRAIGVFLAAVIVSVTFVEAVPPQFGSFHERFAPAALTEDSSVTIRISKWRSVFAGFLESRPDFCQGELLETRPITGGHEIAGPTGAPPADEDARARDGQRKDDVAAIAEGVVDYFCRHDAWPTAGPLDELLVPDFLEAMPTDPATGEDYPAYITGGGIVVGAELEDPADAEGPIYTLGTIPNFVLNPSYESGSDAPNQWSTTGSGLDDEASVASVDEGLFGKRAAEVDFPAGGNFFQSVVYEFPTDMPHTAATWLRSADGEEHEVDIYLTAQTTDGTVLDPLAQTTVVVPGDGAWVHGALQFDTPAEGRIQVLRYFIRTDRDGDGAVVQVDGTSLTRGDFAPSFHRLQNVDPASLVPDDRPGFSDSPLLGVGPRHALDFGSVDNEYVLFLENYGVVGTLAYLGMWAAAFWAAWRAWRSGVAMAAALGLGMMLFIVALMVFNVAAGSFYHFQIMALFWLLVGLLVSATRRRGGAE